MRGAGDLTARRTACALLAICALGWALRILWIDAQSLWADEIYTALYARMADVQEILAFNILSRDPQPPLYYILVHAWVRLAGIGELAFRFVSAAAGLAAIPLIYQLGRRLAGPLVGLLAALILAVNPFHIFFAQEARTYTLVTALVLASTWLLVVMLQNQARWWHFVAYAVVSALSVASHYYAGPVLAAQAVLFLVVWLGFRRPVPWRGWLTTMVVLALPFLALLPRLAPLLFDFRSANPFEATADTFLSWARWYIAGRYLQPEVGNVALVVAAILAAVGGIWFWRQRRLGLAVLLWSVLAPLALIVALLGPSGRTLFEARYFLLLTPPFYILVAAGVAFGARRSVLVPAALAVVAVAIGVAGILPYHLDVRFARPDHRALAAYIQAQQLPGDVIIAVGELADQQLQHYYRGGLPTRIMRGAEDQLRAELAAVASEGFRRAWLVPYAASRVDDVAVEWMTDHAYLSDARFFTTIRLRQYVYGWAEPGPLQPPAFSLDSPLALAGVAIDDSRAEDGEYLITRLAWQLPPDRAVEQFTLALRAVDQWGHVLMEVQRALSEGTNPVNGTAVTHRTNLAVPLPVGTLPGPYRLDLSVYDRILDRPIIMLDRRGVPAGDSGPLGLAQVRRNPVPLVPPADVVSTLRLVQPFTLNATEVVSGRGLTATGIWQPADGQMPETLAVEVVAADGRVATRTATASTLLRREGLRLEGQRPILDFADISTRGIEQSGTYQLVLTDGQARLAIGAVRVEGRSRVFEQPGVQIQVGERLGDVVRLVGATTTPALRAVAPGGPLQVEVVWQALRDPAVNYTVFVQLLDITNRPRAQSDREPRAGTAPTSAWVEGEYIVETHELRLPADLAAGQYRLVAGMYDSATGVRLPITADRDFAILGTVTIR